MQTIYTIVVALIFLTPISAYTAEQLFTIQPSVTPALADSGEYSVGVRTIKVVNPKQLNASDFKHFSDRELTLEVWYPSSVKPSTEKTSYQAETRSGKAFSVAGKAYRDIQLDSSIAPSPLIVISHGYTGYRSMMFYLGEHLASHGYIVASIDHTDSTNSDIDFNANAGAGFPSTLYNRARDQQFVLEQLNSKKSEFSSLIEPQSAAVIGFSMGAYGALNTVGGCYDFSPSFVAGMGFPADAAAVLASKFSSCSAGRKHTDPRWKAMVSFAPWGGEQGVHTPKSLADIKVPAMLVAGDQDDISGFENGVAKLFDQLGSSDKYLMVYQNARHNIAAHPAPKAAYSSDLDLGHYYEPSWNSEALTRINKHMVLAFLDHHLKGDEAAESYLPMREQATQTKGEDGKLSKPWPGFPDRWAVGIRFIRGE